MYYNADFRAMICVSCVATSSIVGQSSAANGNEWCYQIKNPAQLGCNICRHKIKKSLLMTTKSHKDFIITGGD